MEEKARTPRMRTVRQAILEIKEEDPGTALSEKSLRRMIFEGVVPAVSVGNKKLINMDILIEKLSGIGYNDSAIRVS
jgi:hypothetical protein